jgi:hypothetical protein
VKWIKFRHRGMPYVKVEGEVKVEVEVEVEAKIEIETEIKTKQPCLASGEINE